MHSKRAPPRSCSSSAASPLAPHPQTKVSSCPALDELLHGPTQQHNRTFPQSGLPHLDTEGGDTTTFHPQHDPLGLDPFSGLLGEEPAGRLSGKSGARANTGILSGRSAWKRFSRVRTEAESDNNTDTDGESPRTSISFGRPSFQGTAPQCHLPSPLRTEDHTYTNTTLSLLSATPVDEPQLRRQSWGDCAHGWGEKLAGEVEYTSEASGLKTRTSQQMQRMWQKRQDSSPQEQQTSWEHQQVQQLRHALRQQQQQVDVSNTCQGQVQQLRHALRQQQQQIQQTNMGNADQGGLLEQQQQQLLCEQLAVSGTQRQAALPQQAAPQHTQEMPVPQKASTPSAPPLSMLCPPSSLFLSGSQQAASTHSPSPTSSASLPRPPSLFLSGSQQAASTHSPTLPRPPSSLFLHGASESMDLGFKDDGPVVTVVHIVPDGLKPAQQKAEEVPQHTQQPQQVQVVPQHTQHNVQLMQGFDDPVAVARIVPATVDEKQKAQQEMPSQQQPQQIESVPQQVQEAPQQKSQHTQKSPPTHQTPSKPVSPRSFPCPSPSPFSNRVQKAPSFSSSSPSMPRPPSSLFLHGASESMELDSSPSHVHTVLSGSGVKSNSSSRSSSPGTAYRRIGSMHARLPESPRLSLSQQELANASSSSLVCAPTFALESLASLTLASAQPVSLTAEAPMPTAEPLSISAETPITTRSLTAASQPQQNSPQAQHASNATTPISAAAAQGDREQLSFLLSKPFPSVCDPGLSTPDSSKQITSDGLNDDSVKIGAEKLREAEVFVTRLFEQELGGGDKTSQLGHRSASTNLELDLSSELTSNLYSTDISRSLVGLLFVGDARTSGPNSDLSSCTSRSPQVGSTTKTSDLTRGLQQQQQQQLLSSFLLSPTSQQGHCTAPSSTDTKPHSRTSCMPRSKSQLSFHSNTLLHGSDDSIRTPKSGGVLSNEFGSRTSLLGSHTSSRSKQLPKMRKGKSLNSRSGSGSPNGHPSSESSSISSLVARLRGLSRKEAERAQQEQVMQHVLEGQQQLYQE